MHLVTVHHSIRRQWVSRDSRCQLIWRGKDCRQPKKCSSKLRRERVSCAGRVSRICGEQSYTIFRWRFLCLLSFLYSDPFQLVFFLVWGKIGLHPDTSNRTLISYDSRTLAATTPRAPTLTVSILRRSLQSARGFTSADWNTTAPPMNSFYPNQLHAATIQS